MGSVRDLASFRVCLISITCFPVTRGSRPMSGETVGRKHKDHSRLLNDLPAFQVLHECLHAARRLLKAPRGTAGDLEFREEQWVGWDVEPLLSLLTPATEASGFITGWGLCTNGKQDRAAVEQP